LRRAVDFFLAGAFFVAVFFFVFLFAAAMMSLLWGWLMKSKHSSYIRSSNRTYRI